MPTVLALRGVVCTCLGLGVLDLAVINAVLAPRLGAPQVEGAAPTPQDVVLSDPRPAEPRPTQAPTLTVEPSAPVFFATRSARLDEPTRRTLRDVVDRAGAHATFMLEGHADHRGSEATNRDLSRLRALAVASYLGELGVDSPRIRIGYVGETDASGAELWRDRRVDITMVAEVQR